MTIHSSTGLVITLLTTTPAALHASLLLSLNTAMALVATHPEATTADREAAIHLSKLVRALAPSEKQLENGA